MIAFSVQYLLVFFVMLIASGFGTLVGGGSLLTIPLLIILGIPPQQAVATNKVAVNGTQAGGLPEFAKNGLVDWRLGLIFAAIMSVGAVIGAQIILFISNSMLEKVVAIVTLITLAVLWLEKDLGVKEKKIKLSKQQWLTAGVIMFALGIYGGFYGAGLGTFMTYVLILFFGQTYLESAGTRKVPGLAINFLSALVFIYYGLVIWPIAITMFIAAIIGSVIGTKIGVHQGNVWLKHFFAGAVTIMALTLLF